MHVIEIYVENYGPFKGKHTIALGPTVYGIVGRHDDDPGRSNWLGKSWALGAIRFALYGAHSSPTEDGIIHEGEEECSVIITMDDGSVLGRSRKRGKSTQLDVYMGGGSSKQATQKRAQQLIDEYTKMSLADFDASCFIEQKQIARMVLARPAERTEIVNAWLELKPLQEACSHASDHLRNILLRKAAALVRIEGDLVIRADGTYDDKVQEALVEKLDLSLSGLVDLRGILKDQVAVGLQWEKQDMRAAQFDILLLEGRAKKVELEELQAELNHCDAEAASEEHREETKTGLDTAHRNLDNAKCIVGGSFNGHCPVVNGRCFAIDKVAQTRDDARAQLPILQDVKKTRQEDYDMARASQRKLAVAKRAVEDATRKLDQIRSAAKDRADAHDFIEENYDPGDMSVLRAQEEEYDEKIITKKGELSLARNVRTDWEAAGKSIEKSRDETSRLDDQIRTAREAVAILGRGGAQKEIATSALAEIETLANGLLQQASIDLTIAVQWSREGKGLATHCEACGAPFGTSTKVKACPSCFGPRGPKMVEKLELVLSNRSGAADDICGLAFQLAASSWLRAKRKSDWSTVFIDEPFSALDETNARNLSSHLHVMIQGQFGFDQGFLVAHSQQIMGAMPARIVVKSDGTSSRLEVE